MLCVLCGVSIGRNSWSREHVIAQWIRDLFPELPPEDRLSEHRRAFQLRGEDRVLEVWRDKPFEFRVKVLCKGCNNNFLNDIETEAKPFLAPLVLGRGPQTLGPAEQMSLAVWAMKTTMMSQFTHRKQRLTIPLRDFRWFREHRWPLPGEQIWLAAWDGQGDFPFAYHHFGTLLYSGDPGPGHNTNGHAVVFAVGHVIFRAIGNTLDRGTIDMPANGPSSNLRRIWPISGETFIWPPPTIVAGNDGMRSLIDSVGPNAADFPPVEEGTTVIER